MPVRRSAHRRGDEQDRPAGHQHRSHLQQLAGNELLPSQWGGETEMVKTSATTGEGIDELLEMLLTVAELHDYRADPECPARGTCLESELHEDRGVVAKFLVQAGTLHGGDVVVCGNGYGRIKAMYDTLDPHRRLRAGRPLHSGQRDRPQRGPGCRRSLLRPGGHRPPANWPESRAAANRQRDLAAAATTSPSKPSSNGWASRTRCRR